MLSKQQAKIFFLGGTLVTLAIFVGLTIYTLSHAKTNVPQDVAAGKFLWEKNNCMGCHTVMGEGAYYAPELTNVISRRGEAYVKSVLMDKQPWAPHGRKMVAYGFNEKQADELVAFFKWIGRKNLNGFEKVDRKAKPLPPDHMKSNE